MRKDLYHLKTYGILLSKCGGDDSYQERKASPSSQTDVKVNFLFHIQIVNCYKNISTQKKHLKNV